LSNNINAADITPNENNFILCKSPKYQNVQTDKKYTVVLI